ncbi:hypothetical protein Q7C36_014953 [Tachysurus vachellii]|uniref:Uncharacterized protein n=1 Tax=Tachysurus vachellii TaxID=175792 RepID=A0AA88SCB1_TACVA|nr:hypothetical protein Q7C36_014953 [Tachysurus vachellii]
MGTDSAVAAQSSLPSNQAEVEESFSPVEKLRHTQVSAHVLARLGDMSSQTAAHHPGLEIPARQSCVCLRCITINMDTWTSTFD